MQDDGIDRTTLNEAMGARLNLPDEGNPDIGFIDLAEGFAEALVELVGKSKLVSRGGIQIGVEWTNPQGIEVNLFTGDAEDLYSSDPLTGLWLPRHPRENDETYDGDDIDTYCTPLTDKLIADFVALGVPAVMTDDAEYG